MLDICKRITTRRVRLNLMLTKYQAIMKPENAISKSKLVLLSCVLFCFSAANLFAQKQDSVKVKVSSKNEEANRNVMLNASSATGPRQVPIGIPGMNIEVTINEDNLPVSFFFWPNLPTLHWRADASLSRIGLYKLSETGIVNGAVGYAVNSDSQLGGDTFNGKVNYTLNHFGSQQLDMNLNGPLGKGWSYTASMYQYTNPGNFKLGYADELERTQMYKVGLTKTFDKNKGNFSILYKYSKSKDLGSFIGYSYAPFIYKGDGSIKQLSGIPLGTTSNVQREGLIQYMDILTGEKKTGSLNDDNISGSNANEITGLFNYKFDNGMNLKMSAKYQKSVSSILLQIPLGINQNVSSTDGFSYYGTGSAFAGNVQTTLSLLDQAKLDDILYTAELSKQSGNHNWRAGLNEWYSKCNWTANGSFYFQESAAQPHLLTNSATGTFFSLNGSSEAYKGYENKLAAYFTDDWDITKRWNVYYGLRAEYQKVNVDNLPYDRYADFHVGSTNPATGVVANWVNTDRNFLNTVWTASTVYKLFKSFGLLGEVDYNQQHTHLEGYGGAEVPPSKVIPITIGRVGVYYNHKLFSLVSALTYIGKDNFYERRYMTNPNNFADNQTIACRYNVKTVGWTTDIVTNPFKNFNMHFLLTVQNPLYDNFKFTAFNKEYDFSGKKVTGLSQTLMEIDPSYNITSKLRLWTSFRYFGKQYANLSNILYFNGHWETFGGVNYTLNKNVNLGVTLVNFLNQTGVSGSIGGSDLMTDASKYKDYMMTGSYIRPFTAEFKASINF
jgi:hypothetical protein